MKFTADRDKLIHALDSAALCVAKKPIIQVNSCFLLYASAGTVTITANDLRCSIEARISADVERSGAIAVPSETMRSLVKGGAIGAQAVIDAGTDGRLTLRMGRAKYALPTLPPGDFPDFIGLSDPVPSFHIDAASAKRLLSRPLPFVAPDAGTPYLDGVWLHMHDGRLWSIGAGRAFMGAFSVVPAPDCPSFSSPAKDIGEVRDGVVIPPHAASGLLRALEFGGTIKTNGRVVVAEGAHVRFAGHLIINEFPDMWRIVREPAKNRVVIPRSDLLLALKRLSSLETGNSTLDLSSGAGSDTLHLSVDDAGKGGGEDEVQLTDGSEHPFTGTVNTTYLSTLVSNLTGDEVALSRHDNAVNIRIEDLSDPGAIVQLATSGRHRRAAQASEAAE